MLHTKPSISLIIKTTGLILLHFISSVAYAQAPCTLANYGSVPVLNAGQYPYFSPSSGITVNATTAGGVTTLSNFSYNCGTVAYNCTNPAWWINSAAQSITLTFSVPVSAFSIIVNGTNQNEEFYFGVGPGQPPPCIQISDFCNSQWVSINGNTAVRYNGTAASSNMITISNPPGATVYVLTHNGVGAGSRYAVVDCFLPATPGGSITSTTSSVSATCGSCNGSATVNPSGVPGPYNYTWNTIPVQNTQTATNLCAGTYTVTITSGCVSGTATVTVGSSGAGTPPTITPAGPFCNNGGAVNLVGNPAGGTWSGPGITNPATGQFNPTTAGTGTHTITYAVTTPCAASNTVNIVVNAAANATINPVAPVCANAAAFNMTAAQGGGTWSGTGITNTAAGTFNPATAGAGTHTITYTIGGACGDMQTTNVVVNAVANATINPAGPFCTSNAPVNLTAAQGGGTWSGTGITNAATGTFNPTVAGTGNHTITYTIGGACGDVQTTNIIVNNQANATITPAGPFCTSNAPVNLTAVDPGGSWSGTGIINAVAGTFDPNVAGAGTHMITYSIPGACGDVQTTNITVNTQANATITPAGPFCTSTAPMNLTATDPGGTWSGNGITNAALGTFDPNVAGAGIHTITYGIPGVCGDVQTTNITVNNQMDATITPTGPFCESNGNATLAAVDPGGTWSGTGIVNPAAGTFSPSTAGPGTFTITYTIAGACGDVQTTPIQVIADADATINAAGPFCETDLPLNLTSVQAGGTWSGNGITSAANGTFDPNGAGPGTHLITYTINGACGDVGTTNIIVNNVAVTTITPAGPFCVNNSSVNLNAATGGGTWSGPGITNAAAGTFNPATAGAGSHTITYTISGVCGSASTTNIIVNALSPVAFTASAPTGCVPLDITFTNSNGGSTACQWSIDGSFAGNDCQTLNYTFGTAGCYNLTLQTTDGNGCTNSLTIPSMVCALATPLAEFTASENTVSIFTPTIQFNNLTLGANAYLWDFGGLATSSQVNPTFTFPNTAGGVYDICLLATSAGGCVDSVCHSVEVQDEFLVYAPNAFTPGGDGLNEIFLPVITGHNPESFELYIFTRWGELVFQSNDDTKGWDGTHKGIKAKQDVYVWKLVVKSVDLADAKSFIGHINLLR